MDEEMGRERRRNGSCQWNRLYPSRSVTHTRGVISAFKDKNVAMLSLQSLKRERKEGRERKRERKRSELES